jgi:hypothetical protein
LALIVFWGNFLSKTASLVSQTEVDCNVCCGYQADGSAKRFAGHDG